MAHQIWYFYSYDTLCTKNLLLQHVYHIYLRVTSILIDRFLGARYINNCVSQEYLVARARSLQFLLLKAKYLFRPLSQLYLE